MSSDDRDQQYFLDTSYLVSAMDGSDVHHDRAARMTGVLPPPDTRRVFLSDIAINETLTVLARRSRDNKGARDFASLADAFRGILHEYPILCLYEAIPENYKRIIDLMTESGARLGFHDCLIALFLKEVPRVKLVSFDEDFKRLEWLDVVG